MDHQLNEEQLEKLRQFQDIANLQERDLAVLTLASRNWSVENAIEAYLGGAPVGISHLDFVHDFGDESMMLEDPGAVSVPDVSVGVPSSNTAATAAARETEQRDTASSSSRPKSSVSSASVATAASLSAEDLLQDVVVPVPPAAHAGLLAAAAAVAARAMESSDESIESDDDYDYAMEEHPEDDEPMPRVKAAANVARRSNEIPLIPTDCESAIEGTQNFQSVFEARYGKDGRGHLMPPFFIGSLQSAIREAFDCPDRPVYERRPLALYIHHDHSIANNIFPQTVLCNDQVLALLRSQYIVWPWDVTAKENQDKLIAWCSECALYDARPLLASFLRHVDHFPLLILLSKHRDQLRMVDVVTGPMGSEHAVQKLLSCMEAYASSKVALQKQEQERIEREILRKEQERELQESLAVDRERAEKQAREAREAKEAEELAAKAKEEKEAHIAKLKASLPEEPAAGTPGCCAVRFRLPVSTVVLRNFSNTCTLSILFAFLESEGYSVKDYRMMNSDFPQKKDISEWNAKSTLAELKWPAREVINIEER